MTKNSSDRLSSTRSENSLFNLTRKFIKILKNSRDNIVNLNSAADALNVHKRRVYDITNVLEGLGLLNKWSVNSAKWVGGNINTHICVDNKENIGSSDPDGLVGKEEIRLDEEIERLDNEINLLSQCEKNLKNAYVTYEDLKMIPSLKDKMIFSVKAPSDTVMDPPKYEKGTYKLKLSSDSGNILVFYMSDEKE